MTDAPQTTLHPRYPTDRAAFWGGAREAAGVPMMIMGASFLGFGSMLHDIDWTVWEALYSTLSTWALPGQVVMAETAVRGAPLMALALAVGFVNARLLPMVASLLPQVRRPGVPKAAYFAVAMLIAATSWVGTMRRLPDLRPGQRLPFLLGFGLVLYIGSPVFTVIGHHLAGRVPEPVTLALIFLNPIYFMVLFLADLKSVSKVLALASGAALGPLTYLVVPDWSLIVTGLLGGTLAWAAGRWRRKGGAR